MSLGLLCLDQRLLLSPTALCTSCSWRRDRVWRRDVSHWDPSTTTFGLDETQVQRAKATTRERGFWGLLRCAESISTLDKVSQHTFSSTRSLPSPKEPSRAPKVNADRETSPRRTTLVLASDHYGRHHCTAPSEESAQYLTQESS